MKKLAIIGLGPHGIRLFKSAKRIEEIEIVAVVDKDPEKLNHPDIKGVLHKYDDLSQLWSKVPDLDVLLIATNGPSHASIAFEAIAKNIKYILVSKPFTCKLSDAIKLRELAFEKGVKIIVDHALRHDKTYEWIVANIHSGRWGALRSIYIQRPGIGLGCLGVHSFDLANYITGHHPVKVTGWVDEPIGKNPRGAEFVDPGGLVVMEYKNGVRAIISQIEDGSGPMSVEINCNYARIKVDEKFRVLELIEKERDSIPQPNKPVPLTKVDNPQGAPPLHDLYDLMEHLIRELINPDVPLKAESIHGQNSLEILVAAYASHQNGNTSVTLPLSEEAHLNMFIPVT